MTIINLISVFIMLPLLIIYLFHRFTLKENNVTVELFAEALRNENCGYFETAIATYERALKTVKKSRFHESSLKSEIIAKLKTLHTVIDYKNGFHFGR